MDLRLGNRTLHVYDVGEGVPVFWHHGTPNLGLPPEPLFRPGVRWISYDRPGYGTSTPVPGRTVASAATDVAHIADELGISTFAVVGHSGGGPHALACAALLGDRVTGVVAAASMAPFDAPGLDPFAGMIASGQASLRAAMAGRAEKERYETSGVEYDPEFTETDLAALRGPWSFFDKVVPPALANGPGPLIDDDIAYVTPWGFDTASISVPILLLHGARDGIAPVSYAHWLAARIPGAELRVTAEDGHISVLNHAPAALDWLLG
ncbi:alpha/beta fold hydrolase [Nocardia sp. NRRL S-836]|uniref:alpha/beta fold hydrolase n=1 Tax=Nocardia sp. NRRL S-836 TaxID=1519492 RepID=UPI0006AE7841|nr:alpha/beta hydrolase [Nocardia sp. NRRL S-836]KOV79132.1 alpha/beta hydrolase [Nocardia sp. NRRL S-836]